MNFFFKTFVGSHVFWYRLTGGRLGGSMFGGRVLLLTTTGNKSGKKRTVPVMYFEHDGTRAVVASYGGSPVHPAWYKNMQANPEVEVQVGSHRYQATAETAGPALRSEIWQKVITSMPQFAGYEKKTEGREIPIVLLREHPPK
jgi:deazaflavin-dependent oxidoreductase (nitroreductase family)